MQENKDTKTNYFNWLLLLVVVMLGYSLLQMNTPQYSYIEDIHSTVWRINNKTGRGCMVDEKIMDVPEQAGFWMDFSKCAVNSQGN